MSLKNNPVYILSDLFYLILGFIGSTIAHKIIVLLPREESIKILSKGSISTAEPMVFIVGLNVLEY